MKLRAGTSGFAYKEWKGSFYPDDARDEDFLAHYGRRLDTVEINSTFYRMPKAEVLARWCDMVPEGFVFSLKASRRITHQRRLKDCHDSVEYLWKQCQSLGKALGPILFQLPPNFRLNVERLQDFVADLPTGMRAAFEFRHPSWAEDERVQEILKTRDIATCPSEATPDIPATASWGYLRFRGEAYSAAELEASLQQIRNRNWSEVFCYFKHEDGAIGPKTAIRLRELTSG